MMNSTPVSISTVIYHTEISVLNDFFHAVDSAALTLYQSSATSVRLYIIDNSQDTSYYRQVQELIHRFPSSQHLSIQAVYSQKNLGYGRGNNLVLADLHSDYHLICNPDVILTTDSLLKSVNYMEQYPECVLISPRVATTSSGPPHVAKSYPDCLSLAVRYLHIKAIDVFFEKNLDRYARADLADNTAKIELAGGCFLFTRTEHIRRANGFDPKFFMYFEDFDLSIRLREYGEIHYVPAIKIAHSGGDVGKKSFRHHRYFAISAWRFFNKHGWKFF